MSESRPRYRSIFWPLVLIAAGVLFFTGHTVAAVVALLIATLFDVLFVVALRNASPRRRI